MVLYVVAALTDAVEAGGHLPALLAALEAREAERSALRSKLAAATTAAPTSPKDRRTLERRLREKLMDWRVMLAAETNHARQILEELLLSRLVFTPTTDAGHRCYRMTGTFALGRICSQILTSHGMASPTGFEPVF